MTSFKKINTKVYQKSSPLVTAETIHWKQFKAPVLVKEFGAIDYIDFSPTEPYPFAVTSSVRIQIYNPVTKLVIKNLSKFKESAYGGTFRSDGKLLCAGSEEAAVKLFDASSKSLLRVFKGHTAPVHRTYFIHDKAYIASFSDDKSIKIWDIPTEKELQCYDNYHTDYIRAGATTSTLSNVILSGSYDGTVNMYDIRSNVIVFQVTHGNPVEALLYLPSGGLFLSAGGTSIKIWDAIAGGKLLGQLSQHHKAITCLNLAAGNKRILSGSLDRHVKVYDISTFRVVHTLDYPNAVLSLGVSKNDDTLVAGLSDGLVCISRKENNHLSHELKKKATASYKYSFEARTHNVDTVVAEHLHEKQSKVDQCLRKFKYAKALEYALLPYVANKSPHITTSVIQELIRRRALEKSLKGNETKILLQFLQFILRNISNIRFTRVLIDAFNIFLDAYESNIHLMASNIIMTLQNISKILTQEIDLGNELANLQGSLSMLVSASRMTESSSQIQNNLLQLMPSTNAEKNFVVTIS